ncbi:hypothetical protein [Pseudomonas sp. UBA6323]|uniref:hypothetical protein n=1 Tax=Pseudomonas sp. UBA6323 TaxID=1947329 RepID=UPI0025D54F73|nr:hypothetical protein [Pseudomonas sp. UBA6323]
MDYINPARRLHTLLTVGKRIPNQTNCKFAWGEFLGVDQNSPELLRKMAKVMMLPEQIMNIVEKEFPNRVPLQKHWAVPVRTAFEKQNLSSSWESFIGHISSTALDFLIITSDLIEGKTASDEISDDDLSKVRNAFLKVQEELLDCNVSEEVKRYLSRAVLKIIMAVDDYKIAGSVEMLDAIDMALGRAVHDEAYKKTLSETDVGKSFVDAINLAAAVVTVAGGVHAISTPFMSAICGS